MSGINKEIKALKSLIEECQIKDRHGLFRRLHSANQSNLDEQQNLFDRLIEQIARSMEKSQQRQADLPDIKYPEALPISERSDELIQIVQQHQVVVIAGETGSGKSTQLPKICLAAGQGVHGQIAHTQPRRIAARSIAARLSEEIGLPLGKGVGYRVRFNEQCSEQDYIRVLTDGMLLAESEQDRFLNRYDTIIVDEAHERSMNIDFLLGVLKKLTQKRRDLKVIITSATIDTQRFSEYFFDAPVVTVSGRTYPVEVRYHAQEDEKKQRSDTQTNEAIYQAIEELYAMRPGNTLVFLPGEREIREAIKFLSRRMKPGIELLPLYARLSPQEQQRLFKATKSTRIILSTNVSETSLTLPGIDYVVDVGLARISRYSAARRVNSLPVERISQAAANQRKGRCGRVKSGVCIRLYSEDDFDIRSEFTTPEILRTSLAGVVLTMKSRRLGEINAFPFIEPPAPRQITSAFQELKVLGAIDADRQLTTIGQALAKMPVDPRVGRMLYAAAKAENCLSEMTVLAAVLEIPDPRLVPHERMEAARQHHAKESKDLSDFMALLKLWQQAAEQRKALSNKGFAHWCESQFLSNYRLREWAELARRLRDDLRQAGFKLNQKTAQADAVHRALLTGLIENVAMKGEKGVFNGTQGKQLAIFPGSALFGNAPKWIMAAELTDTTRLYARMVAPIQVQWLEQLAEPLLVLSYSEPHWEKKAGHVLGFKRATLMGLPIYNGRKCDFSQIDPEEARAIFIRDALVTGEINSRFEFLQNNLDVWANISALEHKIRRHDVLVDESVVYDFYDAQLPTTVCSQPLFEKWHRSLNSEQQSKLRLSVNILMARDVGVNEYDYRPDEVSFDSGEVKLAYFFKPGSERDGVTATVPLALLNQLDESDFDRAVPSLLREKVSLMIKALPKEKRKLFVPIPNTVDEILAYVEKDTRSISIVLAELLSDLSGVSLQAQEFAQVVLPDHLRMNFEILSDDGEVAQQGRDLATLQQSFGAEIRHQFEQQDAGIERRGITTWDFGDLPQTVTVAVSGHKALAYPALVGVGSSVEIQVFDQQVEAAIAHQQGVLNLYFLCDEYGQNLVKKPLPFWQSISLRYIAYGAVNELREQLLDRVVSDSLFSNKPEIRTKSAFESGAQRVGIDSRDLIYRVCETLNQALLSHHQVQQQLDAASAGLLSGIEQDIRAQLGFLVYEGMMIDMPLVQLFAMSKYLKGIVLRLEKCQYDVEADQRKGRVLAPWWQKYLSHWQAHPDSIALDEFRWMVEAYRLSIYAPSIRSGIKVSEKRLQGAWDKFRNEGSL